MAHAAFHFGSVAADPLDVIEQVVTTNGWLFDRPGDDEIAAEVAADGCVYRLWFAWFPERETLHFSCAFDIKVAETRRGALFELLALINERMWIGHFDLWSEQGLVTFRQTLPLRGGPGVGLEQMMDLVDAALSECERYYPAFQYVIWGGRTPADAMAASILDTVGEA
ncbi:MAG: YbjN domain-containing protein [Alphaproteobacteria bacterium]